MHRFFTALPLFMLLAFVTFAPKAEASPNDARVVRTTTGYVVTAGWEKGLVKGNPNLGHFNWTPMTSYKQGRQLVRQTPGPMTGLNMPRRSVYNRPVHVATIKPVNGAAYAGYGHVSLPVPNREAKKEVAAKIAIPSTSAALATTSASLAAPTTAIAMSVPQIATYGEAYGQLSSEQTYASLSHKDVYGTIRGARKF
jgi:hypothetical protein